jgi:hypothetical protein
MDSERYQFMNMSEKPGRLNNIEAAWYLGFAAHDIPVLIANKMLKPLGDPPPNGGRYFACSDLEPLRLNRKWLDKASALLVKHWQLKNASKIDLPAKKSDQTPKSSRCERPQT